MMAQSTTPAGGNLSSNASTGSNASVNASGYGGGGGPADAAVEDGNEALDLAASADAGS